MKMYELIQISELYDSIKDQKMPLKTAYKFTRLMKKAETEIEFYKKEFTRIISEFCQKNEKGEYVFLEDGISIAIIPGKEKECNMQIADLKNLDVNIDNIKFNISELDGFDLTISQLNSLFSLIED